MTPRRMTARLLALAALAALAAMSACTPARKTDSAEDLAAFAHDRVDEVKNRTRVDFGSKVELIGYDLSPKLTLVVGVWNDSMRLPIISGPTDGHDAAILSHFVTGVTRRRPALLGNNK